jgi:hypothetical protein
VTLEKSMVFSGRKKSVLFDTASNAGPVCRSMMCFGTFPIRVLARRFQDTMRIKESLY